MFTSYEIYLLDKTMKKWFRSTPKETDVDIKPLLDMTNRLTSDDEADRIPIRINGKDFTFTFTSYTNGSICLPVYDKHDTLCQTLTIYSDKLQPGYMMIKDHVDNDGILVDKLENLGVIRQANMYIDNRVAYEKI